MNNKYISFKLIIFTTTMFLFITACKKDSTVVTNPTINTTSTAFSSIKASSNFEWNNSNKITFNFKGQPEKNYNSILKVLGSENSVLLQKLQNGSNNFSTIITLPSTNSRITVIFGDIQKTFITKNGIVTMNLN